MNKDKLIEYKKSNKENYEKDKKEFLKLYESSKKGEVDVYSLPVETLKKMCSLLEEEIEMRKKRIKIKIAKLNDYQTKNIM